MSAELFEFQLKSEQLNTFRLIALDLPGHGQSERLDDYSVKTFRDTISGFAKAMSLGSYVVVGHSFGGHFLIQALNNLSACIGVILIGTPPLKKPLNLEEAFLPNLAMSLLFKKDLTKEEIVTFAKSVSNTAYNQSVKKSIKNSDSKFREQLLHSIQNGDLEDEVKMIQEVQVPLALIVGDQDNFVNMDYIKGLELSTITPKNPIIIKNSGHSPHLENPLEFNNTLMNLIYRLV